MRTYFGMRSGLSLEFLNHRHISFLFIFQRVPLPAGHASWHLLVHIFIIFPCICIRSMGLCRSFVSWHHIGGDLSLNLYFWLTHREERRPGTRAWKKKGKEVQTSRCPHPSIQGPEVCPDYYLILFSVF